jgi:HPt (histidine-containing phosphotransfer) domain-containing protein
MINGEPGKSIENVCDLKYLSDMMGGKKHLINEIMDVFLKQIPEELLAIRTAIEKSEYTVIKRFAHTMKSTLSIMGISVLIPVLQEMEDLGAKGESIEEIKKLNIRLDLICRLAINEIEKEKINLLTGE